MSDYELVNELRIEKADVYINGGPYHETTSRIIRHTELWKYLPHQRQAHVIRDACIVHFECRVTQDCSVAQPPHSTTICRRIAMRA
jgi:hypothetical protein